VERELAHEQVLVSAGRRPVTARLGREVVGMRASGRSEIVTDARQRTANPRIWAAGDAKGGPPYVYTAAAQVSATAAHALFYAEREVDYTALPPCHPCSSAPPPPGRWAERSSVP
jgi:mercuric reductase